MLVTPDSSAMTCCVRNASVAADSLGRASASSRELVCSDCVPPSTAARAWKAVRTTFTAGCCALSVEPAVCVWKRSWSERGLRAA